MSIGRRVFGIAVLAATAAFIFGAVFLAVDIGWEVLAQIRHEDARHAGAALVASLVVIGVIASWRRVL